MRVRPGMHCNVIAKRLICGEELLPVGEDVPADHEVRRFLVVLLQEVVQRWRTLDIKTRNIRQYTLKNKDDRHLYERKKNTNLGGPVVKADANVAVWRFPNGTICLAGACASAVSRADGGVLTIHTLRIGRVVVGDYRLGNVWNQV